MFNDLSNLVTQQIIKFSDSVRDQFGQSIISEIFEPIMQDIFSLQKLNQFFLKSITEIDQLIEELRSIRGNCI